MKIIKGRIIIILLVIIVILAAAIGFSLFNPTVAKEPTKIKITSDKEQTIKVSVYDGEEQNVTLGKGETKTIVLAR